MYSSGKQQSSLDPSLPAPPQKAFGPYRDSAVEGGWWAALLTVLNSCRESQATATGRPTETASPGKTPWKRS